MKASNDSNSLLIVRRASRRSASSLELISFPREVELLEVVFPARHELDAPHEAPLGLLHGFFLLAAHQVDDRRVRVHDDAVARQKGAVAPDLSQDFVNHCLLRLELTRAVAIETRLVEQTP